MRRGPSSMTVAVVVIALAAILVGGYAYLAHDAVQRETVTSPVQSVEVSSVQDGAMATPSTDESISNSQWTASMGDTSPWVRLMWDQELLIAAVQIYGPVEVAFDPKQSTAAALHGKLVFSDGSSLVVSGIAGGRGLPTTIAFTPREVTWVRLEIARTVQNAVVGLRQFRAFGDDVVPPVDRGMSQPLASAVEAAACKGDEAPIDQKREDLQLVCPAAGATVTGSFRLIVSGRPGTVLVARAAVSQARPGRTGVGNLAQATVSETGTAVFNMFSEDLPAGPLAVAVSANESSQEAEPLYIQLVNMDGTSVDQVSGAPAGMKLRYEDEFDGPLTASATGVDSLYMTVKPEPWGGSQFGDAVFADPAWGRDTVSSRNGYLRLRVEPIGDQSDKASWGQGHLGGMLSSQRFGGSGFSAQHAYFEARMLGAPGLGAWSAFWAMNSESRTGRAGGETGELDVTELYGHDTDNACHAVHSWAANKDGRLKCLDLAQSADWAITWHTYAALIEDGAARFFIDGVEVAQLDRLSHTDQPFFFMLDATLGGGWPVDLGSTSGTTDLYVDWVRVYT